MTLWHTADLAFPLRDKNGHVRWDALPADVRVVLGYVAKPDTTPHIWSTDEVASVHNAGLIFSPIVTAPERALNAWDGQDLADAMLAALPRYAYPKGGPVFLDVEHSSYVDNVAGAMACVQTWQHVMGGAGYPVAVPYLPLAANTGWVADWDNIRPTELPAGWSGKQYGGIDTPYGRVDLSVMRPDLWAALPGGGTQVSEVDITAAAAERAADHVRDVLLNKYGVGGPLGQVLAATFQNATHAAKVADAIAATLAGGVPQPSFDAHTTAVVLLAALGKLNAAALAAELTHLST